MIAHGSKTGRLSPRLKGLIEGLPLNVAVVALAKKMARTAWALVAHGRDYQKHYGAQAT